VIAKAGLRELGRLRGRVLLMTALLTLQATTLAGGLVGIGSVFHTRDEHGARLGLADLEVSFTPAATAEMPSLAALSALPGVAAVTRRMVSFGTVDSARLGSHPFPVLIQYLDGEPAADTNVNRLSLLAGRWPRPDAQDEVVIERTLAQYKGLAPGDELTLNSRTFPQKIRVSGVVFSAEFMAPLIDPAMLVPAKGTLGVLFGSHRLLDHVFAEPLWNQLSFRFQPGGDVAATQAAISLALKGLDVERSTPRAGNLSYLYVDHIIGGCRQFFLLAAGVVAMMAAIIAMLTVRRVLAERQREMGALTALGFGPAAVVRIFLPLGMVPGILGGVAGSAGAIVFGRHVAQAVSEMSGLPTPIMVYPPLALLLGALSTIVVGVTAALIPIVLVARRPPAQALAAHGEIRTPRRPRLLGRLLAGRTPGICYALSNLLRRVRLSSAAALMVALAIALPSALLTCNTSWGVWGRKYVAASGWDAIVYFRAALTPDAAAAVLRAVPSVRTAEFYSEAFVSYQRTGSPVEEMRLLGVPVPAHVVRLNVNAGRFFSSPDADEVIVNRGFTQGRHARLGEWITISSRGGPAHRLRVVGQVDEFGAQVLYTPAGTASRVVGTAGKVSGMWVRTDGLPAGALRAALLAHEEVSCVMSGSEIDRVVSEFLASFWQLVLPLLVMSLLLAVLTLVCVLSLLVLERNGEYATLRAMGYSKAQLVGQFLVETGVLGLGALLMAVPIWIGISLFLDWVMGTAWLPVPPALWPRDLVPAGLPTIVLLALTSVGTILVVLRAELVLALRARTLG
jgi:putative ABC transport system permease protein